MWGVYALILWEASCFAALYFLKNLKGFTYSPISERSLNQNQIQVVRALLDGESRYVTHDSDLGWTIKPNGSSASLYHANSQGIRARRNYSEVPDPDMIRVVTFGDSFTEGYEVKNEETWQAQLENLDRRFEVLNFGVRGYGVDQAYLRFVKHGAKYKPTLVIIGFISENILRSVNVFRPFYFRATRLPMAKPRFTIANNKLVLLPNPLPRINDYRKLIEDPAPAIAALGMNDSFYQNGYYSGRLDILPSIKLLKMLRFNFFTAERMSVSQSYQANSEAFQVTLAVLSRFYQEVLSHSSKPVILLLPDSRDVKRTIEGLPSHYQPLLEALKDRKMKVLDAAEAFADEPTSLPITRFFLKEGHYSGEGNRVVAHYVLKGLRTILNENNPIARLHKSSHQPNEVRFDP